MATLSEDLSNLVSPEEPKRDGHPVVPLRTRQHLETSSPVNQNGSFEHDRVIKSGPVRKRTRRTKHWKAIHMFLRPHSLSIYRDSEGTELRHRISLSELTAVTRQKDPKGRVSHVFGVFTPSRNFVLAAADENDAHDWVEVIGREARIDKDEYDMGDTGPEVVFPENERAGGDDQTAIYSSSDAECLSANQTHDQTQRVQTRTRIPESRRISYAPETSGKETFSFSDYSDTAAGVVTGLSAVSLTLQSSSDQIDRSDGIYGGGVSRRPSNVRSFTDVPAAIQQRRFEDAERVACHGWVHYLRTSAHLRQWKKVWMVLRPKSLALYKGEDEYSAMQVLPFSLIVDAVDIDAISHRKRCCMQIITEDRDYKFSVLDEDDLARWLGCFKSLLMKRKEHLRSRSTA